MEFKKIEEGMTATQVAELLDDNFNNIAKELEKKIGENNVPIATGNKVGGITAKERTGFEQNEVVIDPVTGRLYTKDVTVDGGFVPDEEDLTTVAEVDRVVARFKDRDTTKGKGYIILRTEKQIAEQMKQENTIYEIRYDFDLGGGALEVPANCVLDFRGGSFSNGTIKGNNTSVKSSITKIFDLNISFLGTWNIDCCYPEWFGACGADDDSPYIQKAIYSSRSFKTLVKLTAANYYVKNTIVLTSYIRIEGNLKRETTIYGVGVDIFTWNADIVEDVNISNIYFRGDNICAFISNKKNYLSTSFIRDCTFGAELKCGIFGSLILSSIERCTFGYFGTPGTNSTHICFTGDAGNSACNANTVSKCKFYSATGEYSCKFSGGYSLHIDGCNFEGNNCTMAPVVVSGVFPVEFSHNWFEANTGFSEVYLESYKDNVQTVGTYLSKFYHNWFYNKRSSLSACIYGAAYQATQNIIIIENHFNSYKNAPITSATDDNHVLYCYGNWYINCNNIPSDKNPIPQSPVSISSKGLNENTWFRDWSTSNTSGWKKNELMYWSANVDDFYYGNYLSLSSSAEGFGYMYYDIPVNLVKGKTLYIRTISESVSYDGNDHFKLYVNFYGEIIRENNRGFLHENADSGHKNKGFECKVPIDAEHCRIAIGLSGSTSSIKLYAIDFWIKNGLITPDFSS